MVYENGDGENSPYTIPLSTSLKEKRALYVFYGSQRFESSVVIVVELASKRKLTGIDVIYVI